MRATAKVRLHVERMALDRRAATLSVSAGENGVWFDGRPWELETFLAMAAAKGIQRLLVLTSREYLQIVERAAAHKLRVDVFETNFPVFSDIKYSSCPRTNHDVLTKYLRKLDQLGIHSGSLSKDLAHRYLRATLKKLRFKNGYDRHFFFAYKDAYQEVFKLKEERPDRVIIALDFNSMYLDCMKGRFCNPASIEYKDFRGSAAEPNDLASGIYRVRLLAARQSFLLDHHPFRYKRLGYSYYFRMNCSDTIETLLHKDEISYFAIFFERVEIIEGLFSVDTIEHPLLSKGLDLYAERMYHRRRGDRIKENLCKVTMQHMHSATNQKRFAKMFFDDIEQVRDFLSTRFAMNLNTIGPDEIADFLTRHKYFSLTCTPQGYQLSYLDAGASSVVFSLSAQVVANARIKMLKMLDRFLSYRSVELCYANVDSIHLSIHRDEVDGFFEQNRDMISDQLGALKVEAIADQGYWFDVGRYWLKKDGDVVLFKNKGFNQEAAADPFVCRRKVSNFIEMPTFAHLRTYVTKMENSFTYHKRVEHRTSEESRFVRFRYEEIKELHTANLTEARERLSSMKEKVELFRRISKKMQAEGEEG
ncbi:hypothetical protein [Azotobacter armeniacus]